ncbi:MAG: DinB family protein [bacterium]|nr:DinB family protein [bacterium]
MKEGLLNQIDSIEEFFNRSSRCLTEADSNFAPKDGMMTVAQQVAHSAQCIEWFTNALTNPQGFDLDFEGHWKEVKACTSLEEARKWFSKAIVAAKTTVSAMTEAEIMSPLPQGPVMGGAPKIVVIGAMSEHTAHHRGALTVYSRLLGHVPKMPYME